MNEKYNEAIEKLKKYNQTHIISILEKLNEEKQENLINQILDLDFESIKNLYDELTKNTEISTNNICLKNIPYVFCVRS